MEYISIYKEHLKEMTRMSDTQIGSLIRSLYLYQEQGQVDDPEDLCVSMLFNLIKNKLDFAQQAYNHKVESQRKKANNRWHKNEMPNDATASSEPSSECHGMPRHQESMPNDATACHGMPRHQESMPNDATASTKLNQTKLNQTKPNIDIQVQVKPTPKPVPRFVPPTHGDVQAYCIEAGINIDHRAFWDFYQSKGWKVGNQSMKDWKAAVRNWRRMDGKFTTPASSAPPKIKQVSEAAYQQREYINPDVIPDWKIQMMQEMGIK